MKPETIEIPFRTKEELTLIFNIYKPKAFKVIGKDKKRVLLWGVKR